MALTTLCQLQEQRMTSYTLVNCTYTVGLEKRGNFKLFNTGTWFYTFTWSKLVLCINFLISKPLFPFLVTALCFHSAVELFDKSDFFQLWTPHIYNRLEGTKPLDYRISEIEKIKRVEAWSADWPIHCLPALVCVSR